ncbi:MaoC family dehydratase N-terminal domain-containing protein [Streptosporangium saharense]|uniref:FAS1-like dehydratase domain-containing protein n=1 Tax=Streptosporangium saharense TaxID=1706840 RepID=UPI003679BBA7
MPMNEGCVGKVYPPTAPYEVGREKIKEFAAAVREGNAACWDTEAARALGYPDVIAPPSFPMVLTLEAEHDAVHDPELGAANQNRFVHREQRFAYNRPIHAGDVLTVTVRLAGVDSVGGNDVVTYESTLKAADGEHVCTGRSTFVIFNQEGGDVA